MHQLNYPSPRFNFMNKLIIQENSEPGAVPEANSRREEGSAARGSIFTAASIIFIVPRNLLHR
jgi:hypothetical protein